MTPLSRVAVLVGLVVILAMFVGGIVALRHIPATTQPALTGVKPSPPTVDDAESLTAELRTLGEEHHLLEPTSSTRLADPFDDIPPDHMLDATLSRVLGVLAVRRMRHFIEREDLDEASTQRLTAQVMISATRAHLELARLAAKE